MPDPLIDPAALAAHDAAVAEGEATYRDPHTGLFVMTSAWLTDRGYCCGNGCRHCPWPADAQRRAGRRVIRAEAPRSGTDS